jgi:hypothetical protein
MSLENFAHYNDLSPKLREELERKVESFGRIVRYKFDIARNNPDPSRYNGDTVYPASYTLDPTKFNIQDPYEDRAGKSKTKSVALVDEIHIDEKGIPKKFIKVRLSGADRSILKLNIQDKREDFFMAMFLLLL